MATYTEYKELRDSLYAVRAGHIFAIKGIAVDIVWQSEKTGFLPNSANDPIKLGIDDKVLQLLNSYNESKGLTSNFKTVAELLYRIRLVISVELHRLNDESKIKVNDLWELSFESYGEYYDSLSNLGSTNAK